MIAPAAWPAARPPVRQRAPRAAVRS